MLRSLIYVCISFAITLLLLLPTIWVSQTSGEETFSRQKQIQPWPHDIKIYNQSTAGYDLPLRTAVDYWNKSGLDIQFVFTDDATEADLFISEVSRRQAEKICQGSCNGFTNFIGYQPEQVSSIWLGDFVAKIFRYRFVMHELGHVLGLEHDHQSCSLMFHAAECFYKKNNLYQPYCPLSGNSKLELKSLYRINANTSCPVLKYY